MTSEALQLMQVAQGLGPGAWITLGTLALMIVLLVRDVARPELLLAGALGVLLVTGVLAPPAAFAGFSNPAVLTIAALYVVAAGVQRSDALSFMEVVLGRERGALPITTARVMAPTALMSAFLNNTPVVAMLIPRVQQWGQRRGVPASKLLIPLSYASITGGMMTLIGTSTNLVVDGLLQAEGYPGLGFFDLTWVGLPVAVAVLVFFVLVGHRLLPEDRQPAPELEAELKHFLFEVKVAVGAPFAGESVEAAGLRQLGEAYLVHLRRREHVIPATPEAVLEAGDVLVFTGSITVLDRLLRRPGFDRVVTPPQTDEREMLPLYEAVVAASADLVGKTLREVDFRNQYHGAVLAIQRKDEQISGALGRIPIKPGDLLLVEAQDGFDERWKSGSDEFYLVAPRDPARGAARPGKAPVALGLLGVMILVATLTPVPLVTAAFLAALGMIATRCLTTPEALGAINLGVLVVIAAALGLGRAVEQTGLADAAAGWLMASVVSLGPLAVLVTLYLVTNVLTELVTNSAAAVLMLPVALAAAPQVGIGPQACAVLVAVAASASFVTPIGYHTNLMVMAAGGYRTRDYIRAGLPVSLLVMTIAVTVIYWVWV